MDEARAWEWTEQRHTVAGIEAELAADPGCPPQLACAAKRDWFDKHAAAARAEIERLRKCVEELEPAQATCKRLRDYLDDHDGIAPLCTDLGENVISVIDGLLETARAAAKTINALRDRVVELERRCPCSEAHAGDDAVCARGNCQMTFDGSPSVTGGAGPRPIAGLQEICRAHEDALVVHNGTCPACDALRKCMQGNTPVDIVVARVGPDFHAYVGIGGQVFCVGARNTDEDTVAMMAGQLRDSLLAGGVSTVLHGRVRTLPEALAIFRSKQATAPGQGATTP